MKILIFVILVLFILFLGMCCRLRDVNGKWGIFVFCLFLGLLSSCATQRRCNMKFPPKSDSTTVVVVRDSLIYKDTIIYVLLPGKTVIDSVTIPCPPPAANFIPDTAKAETLLARAKAWWSYPNIRLILEQKENYLKVELDSAIREKFYWRNEYKKVTETIKEKYVPKIYRTALTVTITLLVLSLGYIIIKILNTIKP